MKMDLEKKKNLAHLNNVELGSAVISVLAKLSVKDEVKMKIRKGFVAIIVKIIGKLKERVEIQSTSYNPRVTSSNPRVTSSNTRVTSSISRVTSSNPRIIKSIKTLK